MFTLPVKFREVLVQTLDPVSYDGFLCPLENIPHLSKF